MATPNISVEERFWSKVLKTPTCWLWTGVTVRDGYGQFYFRDGQLRRQWPAHRYSYQLENGPIPFGMLVLHKCDNPPCVRPDHLFTGTQADNIADCISKGRRRITFGSAKSHAVINESVALQIKTMHDESSKEKGTKARISRVLGVDRHIVCRVLNGQSWVRALLGAQLISVLPLP